MLTRSDTPLETVPPPASYHWLHGNLTIGVFSSNELKPLKIENYFPLGKIMVPAFRVIHELKDVRWGEGVGTRGGGRVRSNERYRIANLLRIKKGGPYYISRLHSTAYTSLISFLNIHRPMLQKNEFRNNLHQINYWEELTYATAPGVPSYFFSLLSYYLFSVISSYQIFLHLNNLSLYLMHNTHIFNTIVTVSLLWTSEKTN